MEDFDNIKNNLRLLTPEDQEKALTYLQDALKKNKNQEQSIVKFTAEEKKNIAKEALESKNNSLVAKKHNLSESTIRNYIKQLPEGEIKQIKKNKTPKRSRLPKFILLEIKLLQWFIKQRKNKLQISSKDIREEAIRIFGAINTDLSQTFKASNGWMQKFQARWMITFRQSTHAITQLTNKVFENINKLHSDVKDFRTQCLIKNQKLIYINIDEVPLQFDMSGKGTLDFVGRRNVEVIRSNGSHKRLTLVLGLTSIGQFLPPMIIFKTKLQQQIQNPFKKQCIITKNHQGWQTSGLYLTYLQSVIGNYKLNENQQIILFQDSFKGHLTKQVKQWCNENNIKVFDLPAGSTGFIQPVDTSITKKLKSEIVQFQTQFIKDQVKEQNNDQKYVRIASYQNIIEWIINGMEKFDKQMLIQSFKHCGFSLNLDGSEDDELNKRLTNQQQYKSEIQELLMNIMQNKEEDVNLEGEILQKMLCAESELTFEIDPSISNIIEEKIQAIQEEKDMSDQLINEVFSLNCQNLQSNNTDKSNNSVQTIEDEYMEEIEEEEADEQDEEKQFFKSRNLKNIRISNLNDIYQGKQNQDIEIPSEKEKQSLILQTFKEDLQLFMNEYEEMNKLQDMKTKSEPKPKPSVKDKNQTLINSFFQKK